MHAPEDIKKALNTTPITRQMSQITEKDVELFRSATQTQYAEGMPPTFATCYRHGEIDWLAKFGVTIRQVLHAEQEYEYLAPLNAGDIPFVSTTFTGFKGRAGAMAFFIFETTIASQDVIKVRVKSTFVVKDGAKA